MPWYINDSGKKYYEVPDSVSRNDDDAVLEYLKKARSVGDELFEANEASTKNSIQELQKEDQPFTNVAHGANAVAGAAINTLVKPMWEYISKDVPSYLDVLSKFQKGELDGTAAEEAITGLMTGVAGTSMAGNRPAAESAIGMFIGPKGRKNLYGPNYNEAKNQERITKEMNSGRDPVESRDRLWQMYGIEQFADKGIRSEISDFTAELNPNVQEYLKGLKETTGSKVIRSTERLGKVLQDHPDLFKAYPSLKDVRVKIQYGPRRDDVRGSYDFNWDTIELNSDDFEEMRSTLLHEIQHRIQFEEGWGLGNNSDKLKQRLVSELNKEYKTVDKRLQELEKANPEGYLKDPEYAFFEKQAMRLKGYENSIGTSPQTDYEIYKRYWGEAEARNVQRRDIESRTDDMFQERVRPGKSSDVRPKNAIYQLHSDGPVDFPERP